MRESDGERYRGQPYLPYLRGEDPAGEPVWRFVARHGLRCTPVGRGIRAGYRLAEQRRADSERRGRFVWKIVDGEAKATPVRTGDLTEQGLFILEGLNEGDIVVIGGYQKISEGMRVRAL